MPLTNPFPTSSQTTNSLRGLLRVMNRLFRVLFSLWLCACHYGSCSRRQQYFGTILSVFIQQILPCIHSSNSLSLLYTPQTRLTIIVLGHLLLHVTSCPSLFHELSSLSVSQFAGYKTNLIPSLLLPSGPISTVRPFLSTYEAKILTLIPAVPLAYFSREPDVFSTLSYMAVPN